MSAVRWRWRSGVAVGVAAVAAGMDGEGCYVSVGGRVGAGLAVGPDVGVAVGSGVAVGVGLGVDAGVGRGVGRGVGTGAELVAEWATAGGRVVPVPGASAVLAALVAAGLPAARWSFEGFLPRRGRERRDRLERICSDDRATVLFEAPGRVAATLADLAAACGPERPAAVCRELTKIHEEVSRATLAELATRANASAIRGEVTIVVAGSEEPAARRSWPSVSIDEARAEVDRLVVGGMPRSAAAREVAHRTGLLRRDLFRR